MLAPEVWNIFPTRNVNLYKENLDESKLMSVIKSIHYCHSMVAIVPDNTIRMTLSHMQTDCIYYKIMDFDVSELFSPFFLKYFVNEGKVTMLSDESSVEFDNSLAVLSSQHVILKVRRDVYVQLGLEGKPSLFTVKKSPDFYVIQIDLTKLRSSSDRDKKYLKYKQRFSEYKLKFNCLMSWEHNDDYRKCPSSIAFYFTNLGYRVRSCHPTLNVWSESNVNWPPLDSTNPEDLVQFISALTLNIKMPLSISDGVIAKNVELSQLKGFFPEQRIADVYSLLRTYAMNNTHSVPWIGLYVHGFEDTPISFGLEEHCIGVNGDNGFIVFFQPTGLCNVYKFVSRKKKSKIIKV